MNSRGRFELCFICDFVSGFLKTWFLVVAIVALLIYMSVTSGLNRALLFATGGFATKYFKHMPFSYFSSHIQESYFGFFFSQNLSYCIWVECPYGCTETGLVCVGSDRCVLSLFNLCACFLKFILWEVGIWLSWLRLDFQLVNELFIELK